MSEALTLAKNIYFAFKKETTEGTAPTDAAENIVKLLMDGANFKLDKESIETDYMDGVIDAGVPISGMYQDIGFSGKVNMAGGGSLTVAPHYNAILENVIGSFVTGVSGTVNATPTPTTKSFTIKGTPTVAADDIIEVQTGASTYEVTRVVTAGAPGATVAVTVYPYLSAAPLEDYAVRIGTTHKLLSTSFPSGSGFFYMNGSKKLIFTGCRGKGAFNLEVGKPVVFDFEMMAQGFTPSYTAIGYTPTLSVAPWSTKSPICLGITARAIYKGTQAASTTTTSVKISPYETTGQGLEAAAGDLMVLDTTGTGVWETKTVVTVTDSGGDPVTCTCSAFSAVNVGSVVYVIRNANDCMRSLKISVDNTIENNECMTADYGVASSIVTKRAVNLEWDKRFRSWYDVHARNGIVSLELLAVVGSVSGNKIVFYLPNVIRKEVGIDMKTVMDMNISGIGTGTANDSLFVAHL